ncbi:hypothetical protein SAMN05216410_2908 [Sanguibacter gelidistatuariae]|uniref:Uncharacterized protein n=1 Tax=Sanguibacter gelidistatuariae TaxID=1814289 RepID=A0A1G6S9H2_9MICO|nr:hypothetical protein [Sanguibacter gelidistatuariae]SDD13383.1 hypothetical protein SAMN05216410_2908 [Sanguibacter gelidistatuariae]
MKRDASAGPAVLSSLVTVPIGNPTAARADHLSPLRQAWFWFYALAALSAVGFCAFAIREGYASDAELRGGGWTSGETVTLITGLAFVLVGLVLHRRAAHRVGRAAHSTRR